MSDEGREWTTGWTTTVRMGFQTFSPAQHVCTTGPASWKLDSQGNLHIEEMLTDGTEVEVALILAGNFVSVTQEMDIETEPDNEERQLHDPDSSEETPW